MNETYDNALKKYLTPVFERKAVSVVALDVSELTSYTDAIIIIEATSARQVTTMAEHVIKRLKESKTLVLGSEGVKEGEWALLDYGDVIIHIFESATKNMYDLEGFWSDAPKIDLSEFDQAPAEESDDDF